MKKFEIQKNDAGQRVDKFLTKAMPALPPGMLYKAIRLKKIKLNRKRCEISTRLSEGDILEVYLNDEFFETETSNSFLFSPAKLDIIYEDENILLVNKPSGLVVHEDDVHSNDTLINRILHYLYDKGEYNPENEASFIPALCNRIDRNTSGIVIAAKNAAALREMNMIIKDRLIKKQYLCLIEGCPKQKKARLTAYLTKNSSENKVSLSDKKSKDSKTAITEYKILDTNGKISLAEVTLITGRTHQIRAHMAYIGHPLVGDAKYGNNKIGKNLGITKQCLCAYKLTFNLDGNCDTLSYLDKKIFKINNNFADILKSQ